MNIHKADSDVKVCLFLSTLFILNVVKSCVQKGVLHNTEEQEEELRVLCIILFYKILS